MIEEEFAEDGPEDEIALSRPAQALCEAAARLPGRIFAAVDGAQYGNLPNLLKMIGLEGRSLFLEHADAEIEANSGWLVPLDDDTDLAALLRVSDERCCSLVLWCCPQGEDALHRHLRTLNVVQIPKSAVPGAEQTDPIDDQMDAAFANVLFRHYDPNVLGSLLPLLDEAQFARIFGPATSILFYTEDYGGVRMATAPESTPIVPRRPLRISVEQIEDLEGVRSDASRTRIASYLQEVSPEKTVSLSQGELASFVSQSESSGRELGIRSELALGYWAYLNLGSDGRVSASPVARDYLMNCPEDGSADQKMYALMNRLSKTPQR